MKIIRDAHDAITIKEPITLTLGNFDGMHRGHQRLIDRVVSYPDTEHALLTFNPHPQAVLRRTDFYTLMKPKDKIEYLQNSDLDYMLVILFTKTFSEIDIEGFIAFLKRLSVVRVVIGRDARFGYRGQGTIRDLEAYFDVVIVDDIVYNRTRVSTTYIKDLLSLADLGGARKLLGRHYEIHGCVVPGNSVGKKLGFPTANIDFDRYFMPKNGVYYVRVKIADQWHHAMANIGNNPTLNYTAEKRLEIYILDFDRDIYGENLIVRFMHYLRPEKKFANKKALIAQLKEDESSIRKLAIRRIYDKI
ncbi:MAG: bifunctional riboflavin kinase/FAD synthetase [Acholeplasmataceae bacterium]